MRWAALTLAVLGLAGCAASPSFPAGWSRFDIAAAGRILPAAAPVGPRSGSVLTIVIEGDGRGHDIDGRPTHDPTPFDPVGLAIAAAWPRAPVAWLGRLCQYVAATDPACDPADWTSARFSEAAVSATNAAIDKLKADAGAQRIVLVGWSGGGVMAALVAARRSDVAGLATIAAPLDLAAWTQHHRLTPMTGSLDPVSSPPQVRTQVHLYGIRDQVTPPEIGVAAARRMAPEARIEVWPHAHACCWSKQAGEIAALLAP